MQETDSGSPLQTVDHGQSEDMPKVPTKKKKTNGNKDGVPRSKKIEVLAKKGYTVPVGASSSKVKKLYDKVHSQNSMGNTKNASTARRKYKLD